MSGFRILVPVDFTSCSDGALGHAVSLGTLLGGGIIDLLHVFDRPWAGLATSPWVPASTTLTLMAVEESGAGERLQRCVETLSEMGLSVRGRLEYGAPAERILDVAREGYDLVVMGTRGRQGLDRLINGSVAESVMRESPCPVMTVRGIDDGALAASTAPLAFAGGGVAHGHQA